VDPPALISQARNIMTDLVVIGLKDPVDAKLNAKETGIYKEMRNHFAKDPMYIKNWMAARQKEEPGFDPPVEKIPIGVFDDWDMLRFAKARKWNLKAAIAQFAGQLKWRKQANVNFILDDPPEEMELFKQVMPSLLDTYDKYGRPVFVQNVGQIHVPVIKKFVTTKMAVRCHTWFQERYLQMMRMSTAKLGKPVSQVLSIMNLQGLSTDAIDCLDIVKAMTKLDERFYPETLGNTVILNAPSIFSGVWKMIKGFLDPVVASKVIICSKGKGERKLAEFFDDIAVLPAEIGGKRVGGMNQTPLKTVMAGCTAKEEKEFKRVNVGRGDDLELKVDVDATTPQMVHWHFRTLDNDIAYGVFYDRAGKRPAPLVKMNKVNSHTMPQGGQVYIGAGKSGTIRMRLENYRVMFSRTVVYKIWSRPAKDYEIASNTKPAKK